MKRETPKTPSATDPDHPAPLPVRPLDPTQTVDQLFGIYAAGQVLTRRRLAFNQTGGGTRFNISVTLSTGSGIIKVERWSDTAEPPDMPNRGDHICIPITPVVYTTKSGTNFRLSWGGAERGEEF